MHTNTVAGCNIRDICTNFFDTPSNLVPQRNGQIIDFGNTSAVMCVRMADSSSRDPNQNIGGTALWNFNIRIEQRLSYLCELYRSHHQNSSDALVILLRTLELKSAYA